MKRLIKPIFIILFFNSQTNPFFCSINYWQNLNKQKLVIGDCHKFKKISDKDLLFKLLKKLKINNKKTLIILESEHLLDFFPANPSTSSGCAGNKINNLEIDLLIKLENNSYKNINFKIVDLRTNDIFLFINIYRSIIKASNKIDNYKIDNCINKDLFDIFFLNNLELLKQELEDILDKLRIKFISLKTYQPSTAIKYINNLFLKLETSFLDFKNNYNLYKNLENQSKVFEFLNILELDLPDLGFILEITNNEDLYDLIIIITGNDHAVSINNFLEKNNYKLIKQAGLNRYFDNNNHPTVLKEQDIINIFNKIG